MEALEKLPSISGVIDKSIQIKYDIINKIHGTLLDTNVRG